MNIIDKYLKEDIPRSKIRAAVKDVKNMREKDVLKNMGTIEANTLRTAYYGVGDHIEKLAIMLNELCGDTGYFCKDLKFAVQARDAFRKITLGKYL